MNELRFGPACALALGLAGVLCAADAAASTLRHTAGFTPALANELAPPSVHSDNWVHVGPFRSTLDTIAVSPVDPSFVIVSVPETWQPGGHGRLYQSLDDGDSWQLSRAASGHHDITFDEAGRAFACTNGSIRTLTPGNDEWEWYWWPDHDRGEPDWLTHLAVGPGPEPTIWLAGIADGQQTVVSIASAHSPGVIADLPLLGNGYEYAGVAVSGNHPAHVAVVAHGSSSNPVLVWVSLDGGQSWHQRNQDLPAARVHAVRWESNQLAIVVSESAHSSNGLWLSHDHGAVWQQVYSCVDSLNRCAT